MLRMRRIKTAHPLLVLIVGEDRNNWRAYLCSNLSATAGAILEAIADRSAIEQNFHDLKKSRRRRPAAGEKLLGQCRRAPFEYVGSYDD
jgi:hypothetical protein